MQQKRVRSFNSYYISSTCSRLDHKVSGLKNKTSTSLKFAFAMPKVFKLALFFISLTHDTKGTLLSILQRTPNAYKFSILKSFHSLFEPEFFSHFPHGTISLSIFLPVLFRRWDSNFYTDLSLLSSLLFFYTFYKILTFYITLYCF